MDFAALYAELIDSTQMISALIAGISSDDARIKPDPSSWSVMETVCHLCDEERLDFRPRLDALLHQPGAEWEPIDPEGWVVSRRYNEQDLGEVKEKFFAERNKSLDWLKGLEKSDWTASRTVDMENMSAGDMLASWVAHDNLTIRQLVELRRARVERLTTPYSIDYAGDW